MSRTFAPFDLDICQLWNGALKCAVSHLEPACSEIELSEIALHIKRSQTGYRLISELYWAAASLLGLTARLLLVRLLSSHDYDLAWLPSLLESVGIMFERLRSRLQMAAAKILRRCIRRVCGLAGELGLSRFGEYILALTNMQPDLLID